MGNKHYCYKDAHVFVPRTADIAEAFLPWGKFALFVQQVLDDTDPWEPGVSPVETRKLAAPFRSMAVEVAPRVTRRWGVHIGHRAKTPGLSPFVEWAPPAESGWLTIELKGTPEEPTLIRAYSGTYTPPLPWMSSAAEADGGSEFCISYWKRHAYFSRRFVHIKPGTKVTEPPEWFTD